jgi:DNA repair exonuclease SbcCD ATPase subunit
MRTLCTGVVLFVLTLPVFSQDANAQRYQTLSDNMGTAVSDAKTKLENFDQRIGYNRNGKVYSNYQQRFDNINGALTESETRVNRLLKAHDNSDNIVAERDRYESLLQHLEAVKEEYDNWLGSTQ